MYVACIIFIYPAITAYQLLKAEADSFNHFHADLCRVSY